MVEKIRPKYTNPFKVFMDIEISGQHVGKIIFKLFADVCPKTCENFRQLCTGEFKVGYKDSVFHKIIPGFMI